MHISFPPLIAIFLHSDSGDHHDGGGIVSVSPEGADISDHYISTLQYDALAIGNHELYKFVDADYVHRSVEHDRW
jgi:2',3'-cyclic-nucleotide 2'-phosphodiesterase (5'-nucleotidase family)